MPVLRRMQHQAGSAYAIGLDVETWIGAPPSERGHLGAGPAGLAGGSPAPARPTGPRLAGAGPRHRHSFRHAAAGSGAGRRPRSTAMRPGRDLGSLISTSLLAGATTWVAMLAWRGFTEVPRAFLAPSAHPRAPGRRRRRAAALAAGARVGRLPRPARGRRSGRERAAQRVAPAPGSERGPTDQLDRRRLRQRSEYAAPVPSSVPGVHPLLIIGGLACLLLVDLLACTLRRSPLAGLPLLTIYAVPISVLGDGVSWWIFVGTTAGFLHCSSCRRARASPDGVVRSAPNPCWPTTPASGSARAPSGAARERSAAWRRRWPSSCRCSSRPCSWRSSTSDRDPAAARRSRSPTR